MWSSLKFRPIGPLALRGPGEISTGFHLRYIPLPLPSTLLGSVSAIGWYSSGKEAPSTMSKKDRILRNIKEVLNCEVKCIRGPYLCCGSEWYIWAGSGLVNLNQEGIREWINRQEKGEMPGKRAKEIKNYVYYPRELSLRKDEPIAVSDRTGVSLDRKRKVVKFEGGALFTVPYVDFNGEIVLDFNCDSDEEVNYDREFVVRLGGESRISRVSIEEGRGLYNKLEEIWRNKDGEECIAVLASPMLLEDEISEVGDLIKLLEKEFNGSSARFKGEIYSVHPRVRVEVINFYPGYDEVMNKKEKMIKAILPGAAFPLEVEDWRRVYSNGIGKFREIGYGTVVPIPS